MDIDPEQLQRMVYKLEAITIVQCATTIAQAKIAAMQAANQFRQACNSQISYGEEHFFAVEGELEKTLKNSGLSPDRPSGQKEISCLGSLTKT